MNEPSAATALPAAQRRRSSRCGSGPALILLDPRDRVVSLTTPVFFTSRNIGNVLSQTAVIARARARAAARDRHAAASTSRSARRSRSRRSSARSSSSTSHSTRARDPRDPRRPALAVGPRNGLVYVLGRDPAPVHRHAREPQHRARASRCGPANGTLIPGMPRDRADARRRLDRLAAVLVLRRRSALACSALVADDACSSGGGGCTRSAATPTRRAGAGIPVGRVLISVYVAERPRGRRRRARSPPA